METSPLRFLKDFDLITILNKEVSKSRERIARQFHLNLYKDKLDNNGNYFFKVHIDNTFWKITQKRILNEHVSFLPPVYPFYNCPISNQLVVEHAIRIYEEYNEGDLLPCGILSTGAQCICDVCTWPGYVVMDDDY